MAKFIYQAKRGLAEMVNGTVEASSQEEALNLITARGLFPVSLVADSAEFSPKKSRASKRFSLSSRRISSKEILVFTQKLATLTRARLELFSSLRVLYDQTEESPLKEVILQINNSVKEGKVFSESLRQFPQVFSPFFVNVIRAGEASGRLDLALAQIGEFLLKQESLKNRIRVAMAYPAVLLAVGLTSIVILVNFVIPRLGGMLQSMGRELPLITRVILKISDFSQSTSGWIFPALLLIGGVLFGVKGPAFFYRIAQVLKDAIPAVKKVFMNQELAHFSYSLGLLLKSGVPALESLRIASQNMGDPRLKEQLAKVCERVACGETISHGMEKYTDLPVFFVRMIVVGEESGMLADVLDESARAYTRDVESDVAVISSLIEPLLILFLGSILGLIVFAIVLPIFQITQFVQ